MPLSGDPTEAAAAAALDRIAPPGPLGLAVSGGSDSLALMRLAGLWAEARGRRLAVATVDHGLRPEAAAEAAFVARRAGAHGLSCDILPWRGWEGRGNLQAAARAGRARLLADWAAERGLAAIALGHTRDDQAETVLLRLARGSGVDGLSAMAERAARDGALWLRPLLGLGRTALRDWLSAQGERWIEDPSNEDDRFARTRARRALAALAPLGLDAERLAETAARMGRARAALEAATARLSAEAVATGRCGEARIALAPLAAAEPEIRLRLLARALQAVSGAAHPPRLDGLERLAGWALSGAGPGAGRTLHGCEARLRRGALLLSREAAAAEAAPAPEAGLWDGRWRVSQTGEGVVGALGAAGLRALCEAARGGGWRAPPGWRDAPAAARRATPALWRRGALAAAPVAAYGGGLSAGLLAEPAGALKSGGRPPSHEEARSRAPRLSE